jgi:hypothetical protein
MDLAEHLVLFFQRLRASVEANRCHCHEDCLIPGRPRRADCLGEHRSGCANCSCFGLVGDEVWSLLKRERRC